MNNGTQQSVGMLDSIKNTFQPRVLMDKIRESKDFLIEVGIYSMAGFLAGFLFKRYSRYLVVFLVFIGVLFLLQKNGMVSIAFNHVKINEFLGVQMPEVGAQSSTLIWEWIKSNVVITISFLVGFLSGMRIG